MSQQFRNPFTNRSTILTEEGFVGRETEIRNILSRVRNADSVSIVGPRRIGKSSLLYHFYLTGNKRLGDTNDQKYKFVYLDLQEPHFSDQRSFCTTIADKLGAQITPDDNPLISLSECLESFKNRGILVIFLMDEFEKLTGNKEKFDDDFFNMLRAFGNQHKAALMTTSAHSLKELTDKSGLTSPLYNIFTRQNLGEFTVSDTLDEVALFLSRFWKGDLEPSVEEQSYLISYCSRHPLIMQVVSYWVLENRFYQYNEQVLKEKINENLSDHFRDDKEKIKKWLKTTAPHAFEKIAWTAENIAKIIKPFYPTIEIH